MSFIVHLLSLNCVLVAAYLRPWWIDKVKLSYSNLQAIEGNLITSFHNSKCDRIMAGLFRSCSVVKSEGRLILQNPVSLFRHMSLFYIHQVIDPAGWCVIQCGLLSFYPFSRNSIWCLDHCYVVIIVTTGEKTALP